MDNKKMMSHKRFQPKHNLAMFFAFIFCIIFGLGLATPVESKTKKSKKTKTEKIVQLQEELAGNEATKSASSKQRVVSLSFKQMGAWSAVKLRGVDGAQTLSFPIRADEVVVAAKLKMTYDYSPALIAELSHLKVSLNERMVAVEALPKEKGFGNKREIDIDPSFFGSLNYLQFKLIGHYTLQCEDPFHSSLWLNLSDIGHIELTLMPVSMANDLKTLPLPFLDKRENAQLKLPFVFAAEPSLATLKAAGVVASWFGIQAGSRTAQFPTSIKALPDGHAVVFLKGNDRFEGVKNETGSSISIQSHPNNPQSKLLVISGSTDEELARAARAIALFASTLSGQQVTITQETDTAARKPYDAPAWLPIDRPVSFGELARLDELKVQGYFPNVIRINYRVSPDLFTWRTPGAQMNLKYRSIRLPNHVNSSLNINQNANFIQAIALNSASIKGNDTDQLQSTKVGILEPRSQTLYVPPYAIGGRDQLQFAYFFDIVKEGPCKSMPPDNFQASIDAESTIDYSGFPRYVALPNLAYFATMGFPYTRMADLSETAILMAAAPNADEISMYLTLMGRMGEATGFPAVRHALVADTDADKMSDHDLIVISSGKNSSLMAKWASKLPVIQNASERRVREPFKPWWPSYRWEQKDIHQATPTKGSMTFVGPGNLTTMMAFESPLKSSRSVVFMFADLSADLRKISEVLTDAERIPSIQGDFAVINDKTVNHATVGETYYMGSLPWLNKLKWFFSDQPLILGLIALLISILVAAIVYKPLKRLFAKRFQSES
jgi:cellulose synthase operon protein B